MITIDRLVWNDGLSDYEDMWVEWGYYNHGGLALQLCSAEGPVSMVTTNLAAYEMYPAPDCFWIKNYSENKGLGDALVEAGVVERTGRATAVFGPYSTTADEYRFTEEAADDVFERTDSP